MGQRDFVDENCSIARALVMIGDGWSLMILREAFLGQRRFGEFQSRLEISKNILSQRLEKLVDVGIMKKVDVGVHGPRYEYVLTKKGKDLITVMTALRQWGDRWIFGEGNEPLLVMDRRTGKPIEPVRIARKDGSPVPMTDLSLMPGPGATERAQAEFEALKKRRS